MDSAKLKKLQDYSVFLTQQAEAKESRGEQAEAVKDYVKLVDVLLLLASEVKDHPTWQQMIGRAEAYQKKARAMAGAGGADRPNAAAPVILPDTKSAPPLNLPMKANPDPNELGSSISRFKSLRKFIGINPENPNADSDNDQKKEESSWLKDPIKPAEAIPPVKNAAPTLMLPAISSAGSQISSMQQQIAEAKEEGVPRDVYSKVLEEKIRLQREIETMREKERAYLEMIETKNRQFSESVSNMVSRSEYEAALSKLKDSVPRADYEQALSISTIPKERYIELQSQITDLELKLQNSVPRIIVDEIAEYVTFLVSMVLSSGEEKKMEAGAPKDEAAPQVSRT